MFERYWEDNSDWISRESLSVPTRRNLRALEKDLGYQFDDQARKAQFGIRPSYIIYGTSPLGEEVVYERRETHSRAAGQTFIWEGGKKSRLGDLGLPVKSFASIEYEVERKARDERPEIDKQRLKILEEKGEEEERIKQESFKEAMEEVEELDTFSSEEQDRVKTLLSRFDLYSTSIPSPIRMPSFLTKEEKEIVKEEQRKLRERYLD